MVSGTTIRKKENQQQQKGKERKKNYQWSELERWKRWMEILVTIIISSRQFPFFSQTTQGRQSTKNKMNLSACVNRSIKNVWKIISFMYIVQCNAFFYFVVQFIILLRFGGMFRARFGSMCLGICQFFFKNNEHSPIFFFLLFSQLNVHFQSLKCLLCRINTKMIFFLLHLFIQFNSVY